MRILGIDPGSVSAAWALLDTKSLRSGQCGDIPVVDRMVDAAGLTELLRTLKPTIAVIELVGSMPKQGVSSTFRFGFGCGVIRGVVQALAVPVYLVTPTKWKKAMQLDSDGEKSRAMALRMFPEAANSLHLKKHHGRAEALLLAEYFRRSIEV